MRLGFSGTIWFPYVNYSLPAWVNCKDTVPSVPTPPGPIGSFYDYCISISSTSFFIVIPSPGPK